MNVTNQPERSTMKLRHKIQVYINIDDVARLTVRSLSGILLIEFYGLNIDDAIKQYNDWMENN